MNIKILVAIVLFNFLSFGIMCLDKYLAKIGAYRVPEKWLIFLSLIGGGIGTYLAMQLVRHKTKHGTFVYGIPFCILLNVAFLYPLMFVRVDEWFTILSKFFYRK